MPAAQHLKLAAGELEIWPRLPGTVLSLSSEAARAVTGAWTRARTWIRNRDQNFALTRVVVRELAMFAVRDFRISPASPTDPSRVWALGVVRDRLAGP